MKRLWTPLDSQQGVSGYDKSRTKLEVSSDVNPLDVRIHEEVARQVRADNSRLTQLKENVFGSSRETPVNSRKYELEFEASKHNKMAEWREAEVARLPADHPDRMRLQSEATALRERAKNFTNESNNLNDQLPKGKIAADDDVFNLDPKQAKNNIWRRKGRPSNFSRDTLDTLAAQQPDEHVTGTTNLDGNLSRTHRSSNQGDFQRDQRYDGSGSDSAHSAQVRNRCARQYDHKCFGDDEDSADR